MKVDILFVHGCPNHRPTVALVREVVSELGIQAEIREVEVASAEDAKRLRFLGSPTIQIRGLDIEPGRRGDKNFGMSCRMYVDSGVPPKEMIMSALEAGAA